VGRRADLYLMTAAMTTTGGLPAVAVASVGCFRQLD
jgi:hypothetical protein